MLYTQLTKEVIDKLRANWAKYHNARVEALTQVCIDANDGYYESIKDEGLLLTEEEKEFYGDYDPTSDWFKGKQRDISWWQKDMLSDLKYEGERFKDFLKELSELKFYDYQVGSICIIDFSKLEYEFVKTDDPKKARLVSVRFVPTSHWYAWDGKYKRTVKFEVVDPDFTPWVKE